MDATGPLLSTENAPLPDELLKVPWIVGIDTLSDEDWMDSNPDGKEMLLSLRSHLVTSSLKPHICHLVAKPLRNLVKLAIERLEEGSAVIEGFAFDAKGFFDKAAVDLARYLPGAPKTVTLMTASLLKLANSIRP